MIKMRSLILALSALLITAGAYAQSPVLPTQAQPIADPPRLEGRGELSNQQLLEWQRQRAEEYNRRLREYLATVGRMA
jgi:hypothetical protein